MKDIKAVLILAFLLSVMFQLTREIASFEDNWALSNPIIISVISCLLLTLIQRDLQNDFLKHLLKAFKVNILTLLVYFPMCLLLSVRWVDDLKNSINTLIGVVPTILSSSITAAIALIGTILISAVISYFVGMKIGEDV